MNTRPPSGVVVCFRQYWDEEHSPLIAALLPWYDRAVLGIIFPDGLAVYACHDDPDHTLPLPFSMRFHPWDTLNATSTRRYRILKLRLSSSVCEKIHAQCEACVRAGLQYSLADLSLSLVPFRNPIDLPISQVKNIRNVQAVILILRECLDPAENSLGVALRAINSRTTNPTELLQILVPYAFFYYPNIHKKLF